MKINEIAMVLRTMLLAKEKPYDIILDILVNKQDEFE